MASPARKVYWDTSCFICFLNRKELDRRKICEDVLRNAQAGNIVLHTSTWTIAETVKPKAKSLPGARTLSAKEIAAIDSMFRWSWIKKIDVDQRIAFRSVELSRDFNLDPVRRDPRCHGDHLETGRSSEVGQGFQQGRSSNHGRRPSYHQSSSHSDHLVRAAPSRPPSGRFRAAKVKLGHYPAVRAAFPWS